MNYNLFSSIDADLNFPPEILKQLSNSIELRHLIIPLSKATRDNLLDTEKWDGRVIYNTTSKRLEVWVVNKWKYYIDETTLPPILKKPWDKNFNLPVAVQTQLRKSDELKTILHPYAQSEIDLFLDTEKWDGRVIYNTTSKKLEVYKENFGWSTLFNPEYQSPFVPHTPDFFELKLMSQLDQTNEFKYLVVPMTTADRNLLTEDQLWEGRVIYNTTDKVLEFFDSVTWAKMKQKNYWKGWFDPGFTYGGRNNNTITLENGSLPPFNTTVYSTYIHDKYNNTVVYNFAVRMSGFPEHYNTEQTVSTLEIRLDIPFPCANNSLMSMGPLLFDIGYYRGQGLCCLVPNEQKIKFYYVPNSSKSLLLPVTGDNPSRWQFISELHEYVYYTHAYLYGQIIYEAA